MSTNVISCVVGEADYAEASNAVLLPLHKLAHTLAYNSNNSLNYMQVTYLTIVYRKTYTYDASSRVIGETIWTVFP